MYYICSQSRGPFLTIVHTTLWEASFSDWKKLSFGVYVCSYLIETFQNFLQQILTHSLFKGIEVGLKLFLIYTSEMLVGALWKQST